MFCYPLLLTFPLLPLQVLKFTNISAIKMETTGLNEAITALVTMAVAAVIRYFEKRKMAKDQETEQHFRK